MVVGDLSHEATDFSVLGLLPFVNVHSQFLIGLRYVIDSFVRYHTGLEREKEGNRGGREAGRERKCDRTVIRNSCFVGPKSEYVSVARPWKLFPANPNANDGETVLEVISRTFR